MGLIVQKFGGSSVRDRERLLRAMRIVRRTWEQGDDVVVVLSAQAYRTTVDGASAHTRKRIAAAFVRNAVRAQDERGAIAVEDRDGLPVLALSSEWDGERYVQYIYGYQGQLCELFTAAEYDFVPEDGEPVCAAQAFEPTLEGDLLTVRVTDETGHVSTVYIARRCAQ